MDGVARPALEASAEDVLAADGYLLGTPVNFGYLWISTIVAALVLVLLVPLKVEQANQKVRREQAAGEMVEQ